MFHTPQKSSVVPPTVIHDESVDETEEGSLADSVEVEEAPPKKSSSNFPIRLVVLAVLCLQNSLFTVLRRYALAFRGIPYSKYEVLFVGEVLKLCFSACMIARHDSRQSLRQRFRFFLQTNRQMMVLALLYGLMNLLALMSLRNIGAGLYTVFAQCNILTTALSSTLLLHRQYSATQWRALLSLSLGVLLFSQPVWSGAHAIAGHNAQLGILAVLVQVSISGFSSVYLEKVLQNDTRLTIWERNFQLAVSSIPVYLVFIVSSGEPLAQGWTPVTWCLSFLGAAGGLLVALSIKYGDSILKTLATTGAILLSSVLDHWFLQGPLTPVMMIAAGQVVLSISNYTFDQTRPLGQPMVSKLVLTHKEEDLPA